LGPRFRSPGGPGGRSGAGGALDLAGLEARGADVHPLRGAVHVGAHALDVRVPPTARPHVVVRDRLAEAGLLAADVAGGSHGLLLNLLLAHDRVIVDGQYGRRRTAPGRPREGNLSRIPDA